MIATNKAGAAQVFPCGHPRTPENSQSVGVYNGVRCKECRRRIAREWRRKKNDILPENFRLKGSEQ